MLQTLKTKAKTLGASDLKPSTRKNKKYMVKYKNHWIHFGAHGYSDYTRHKDIARRARYRTRHKAIRLKDGRLAYQVKSQPAYWAYHILW